MSKTESDYMPKNLFCHVRITHTLWVWDRVGTKSLETLLPVSGWITGHQHKNIFEHEQNIISVSLLQVVFLYGSHHSDRFHRAKC